VKYYRLRTLISGRSHTCGWLQAAAAIGTEETAPVQAMSRPCDPPPLRTARVCVERTGRDVLGYLGRTGRIHYCTPCARPPLDSPLYREFLKAPAALVQRARDASEIQALPFTPAPSPPCRGLARRGGFAFLRTWEETRAKAVQLP